MSLLCSLAFYKEASMNIALRIIILCSILLPVTSLAADELGFELYPQGDLFIYGEKDFRHFKADVWAIPGSEVAFTFGPSFDWFEFGLGFSSGIVDDKINTTFLDLDFRLQFDYKEISFESYNLYQLGQHGLKDMILLRHDIYFKDFPLAIIGHNVQDKNNPSGEDDFQLFWGLSYNFHLLGKLIFNRLCFAVDVQDFNSGWSCWVIEF